MNTPIPYHDVLVIIPAYREGAGISALVSRIRELGFKDVLVVDDGSPDDTKVQAQAAGAMVKQHIINRGPGAATMTGLTYARKKGYGYAVTIDGDNQHDPADIPALLRPLLVDKADVVIGNRFMKGDNFIPRERVFYNGIANLITFTFSGRWVSDTQSGLKALNRKAMERIRLSMDGYEFCSEMVIRIRREGLEVSEVPVFVHYDAETTRKGQGLLTGIRTLGNLLHHLLLRP